MTMATVNLLLACVYVAGVVTTLVLAVASIVTAPSDSELVRTMRRIGQHGPAVLALGALAGAMMVLAIALTWPASLVWRWHVRRGMGQERG